jgi:hypothetical protein
MRAGFLVCLALVLSAAYAGEPAFGPHRFDAFAAEVYTGPRAKPDFKHSARRYRNFPTRLRAGAKGGPNFAGHWAIVGWGCGTGCIEYHMVDSITGAIRPLPFEAEHDSVPVVIAYPDSRLVKAFWDDFPDRSNDFAAPPICHMTEAVWEDDHFNILWSRRKKGSCPYYDGDLSH